MYATKGNEDRRDIVIAVPCELEQGQSGAGNRVVRCENMSCCRSRTHRSDWHHKMRLLLLESHCLPATRGAVEFLVVSSAALDGVACRPHWPAEGAAM